MTNTLLWDPLTRSIRNYGESSLDESTVLSLSGCATFCVGIHHLRLIRHPILIVQSNAANKAENKPIK